MINTQDKDLVRECQGGNKEAFGELARKYQTRLFHVAYRFLGNQEDARGAVQDAFILAYKSIRKFRGEASFYTWLCRILINFCYRKMKKRKKVYSLEETIQTEKGEIKRAIAAPGNTPRQALIDKETQEIVQKAINSLREKYRAVVLLYDFEGLSYQEISGILNCPVGTVRSRLHRARLLLRERLKGQVL